MDGVPWARDLARQLLAEPLPTRWAHTQGVGRKAQSIAHIVGEDAELLICAAWLHDIGYSPELAQAGFHPLDGARFLRDNEDANPRLCRLVANHSCASIEARGRSLAQELAVEFPATNDLVADAMTYCDMTTDRNGSPVDIEIRIQEILGRYGINHIVARSIGEARQSLVLQVQRIVYMLPT